MSDGRLAFCFGVHNHQPVGQFDAVFRDATARAYHPFLERLAARPEVRCTLHWTGSLLTWLRDEAPATFDLLGAVAARGQVELLTGGFYEPILAVLPDRDKLGQIERLTEFLKTHFGVRPRGLWLAERVWEPHLPKALREAGVDYVLLDDWHFALAGLDPETLQGWYTTDEQGAAALNSAFWGCLALGRLAGVPQAKGVTLFGHRLHVALDDATRIDPRMAGELPTTKGLLEGARPSR